MPAALLVTPREFVGHVHRRHRALDRRGTDAGQCRHQMKCDTSFVVRA